MVVHSAKEKRLDLWPDLQLEGGRELRVEGASFESKVGASSRRWELRVEGGSFESKVELGVELRVEGRTFESKVRASFKLEVAGGPVESVESKVFGASSRRSTFESKVGASSRRWELRVEGRTFESKVGPQGWVQMTPRAY